MTFYTQNSVNTFSYSVILIWVISVYFSFLISVFIFSSNLVRSFLGCLILLLYKSLLPYFASPFQKCALSMSPSKKKRISNIYKIITLQSSSVINKQFSRHTFLILMVSTNNFKNWKDTYIYNNSKIVYCNVVIIAI